MAYQIKDIFLIVQTTNGQVMNPVSTHTPTSDPFTLTIHTTGGEKVLLESGNANNGREWNTTIQNACANQFEWDTHDYSIYTDNISNISLSVDGDNAWQVDSVWVIGHYMDSTGVDERYLIGGKNGYAGQAISQQAGEGVPALKIQLDTCPNDMASSSVKKAASAQA